MHSIHSIKTISEPVRILRRIKEVFPQTIIAGGYYRDIYHNIPFSDVDIFIDTHDTTSEYNVIQKAHHAGCYKEDFWIDLLALDMKSNAPYTNDHIYEMGGDEDYYPEEEIEMIWDISCNGIKYNLILLSECDPIKFVREKFDFGICKVYSDGIKVSFMDEFIHDSRTKTLSFTTEDVTFEYFIFSIKKHLPKLKKKYPGYNVYIPPKHLSHVMNTDITI